MEKRNYLLLKYFLYIFNDLVFIFRRNLSVEKPVFLLFEADHRGIILTRCVNHLELLKY